MTAPLSRSAAAGHPPARVVSVSPMTAHSLRLHQEQPETETLTFPPPQYGGEDDAQAMTKRARELIASLNSVLDQAAMGDARARDTVHNLQDRLRVSARMLQAFQAQISRIEEGICELQRQREVSARVVQDDAARLDDQAAAFEQRLEAALDRFEQRLAHLGRVL